MSSPPSISSICRKDVYIHPYHADARGSVAAPSVSVSQVTGSITKRYAAAATDGRLSIVSTPSHSLRYTCTSGFTTLAYHACVDAVDEGDDVLLTELPS